MKNIFILVVLGFLVSCTSSTVKNKDAGDVVKENSNNPPSAVQSYVFEKLSVADFKLKLQEKGEECVLIDVRSPQEVANGVIPKAQNINYYDDDFKQQLSKLDKSKPTFVYCMSGGRSGRAMGVFKELGFREVYDLSGGYNAWSSQ